MEPAFIVFGGTVFYTIVAIVFVALLVFIEYDMGWGASIVTLAAVLALTFGVEINIFVWTLANPWLAFKYLVYYFALGTGWAIAKWCFYCFKLRPIIKDAKIKFLNTHKIAGDKIPVDKKDEFAKTVTGDPYYTDKNYPPQSMEHKSDWLMWATWWPTSFFWTILNQPIKNAWLFIYSRIAGTMQHIANKITLVD